MLKSKSNTYTSKIAIIYGIFSSFNHTNFREYITSKGLICEELKKKIPILNDEISFRTVLRITIERCILEEKKYATEQRLEYQRKAQKIIDDNKLLFIEMSREICQKYSLQSIYFDKLLEIIGDKILIIFFDDRIEIFSCIKYYSNIKLEFYFNVDNDNIFMLKFKDLNKSDSEDTDSDEDEDTHDFEHEKNYSINEINNKIKLLFHIM